MKKHLPLILSAVACLLAAVCLWRIVLLEQAVEEQISELRTLDSSVVDLQSLPGQVQDALDRSASLLVDKNQSFGKLNTADYTVPMTVTVTPKEQTPGVATATLVGNGTSYPMEAQKDGSFSVVIPCPLLQTVSLDRVIFMDNGTQRIETLEYEALAVTDAIVRPDLSLQATVSMKEGKLCYEGQLAVQQENLPHAFQTMRIVADIDGKQVKETPIDLDPKFTEEMAQEEDLVFLCGHYEGIDERVLEEIVTDYVSIGDYVLTGGELPAMVMMDSISRMVPGVLNNQESGETESFAGNLLEYPQYSRPEEWHGKKVPEVLMSGHHANIEKWRREQSIYRTAKRRPDLLKKADLTNKEWNYVRQLRKQWKEEEE